MFIKPIEFNKFCGTGSRRQINYRIRITDTDPETDPGSERSHRSAIHLYLFSILPYHIYQQFPRMLNLLRVVNIFKISKGQYPVQNTAWSETKRYFADPGVFDM
jgi:hypothetical protein